MRQLSGFRCLHTCTGTLLGGYRNFLEGNLGAYRVRWQLSGGSEDLPFGLRHLGLDPQKVLSAEVTLKNRTLAPEACQRF